MAGFGGVLRDETGNIVSLFHCHLGKATNNMVELMDLEECLDFLKQDHYHKVIIEADLELVINATKKLSHGTGLEKVTKHWRLTRVLQKIQMCLKGLRMLIFNHVCRKANKLVDILANQGVTCKDSQNSMIWREMPQSQLKALCHTQAEEHKREYQNRT